MSAGSIARLDIGKERTPLNAVWARALSPDEWREIPHQLSEGDSERLVAEELVRRWRKVISARAGSDEAFHGRLRFLGIAEEDAWRRFLPARQTVEITAPAWAQLLDQVLAMDEDECLDAIRLLGSPLPEETSAFDLDKYPQPLFPHFLAPFLAVFVRSGAWEGLAAAPLCRALLRRLSRLCARTASYELKLARHRGDLEGADPHARYEFFCRSLIGSVRGRRRIFETYPVLGRLLATVCGQMIEVSAEVSSRLRQDREEISEVLNDGGDPGAVSFCLAGLSDVHRGGRSAWILRFENGLQIVYKPRSHRVDAAWVTLIDWFNARGSCLSLRAAKIIERDGYGWSEFIAHDQCASEAEAARFYQRQGTLGALVWLLCGQDLHADNIIAAGDHPIAVDLEGLLAPGIAVPLDRMKLVPQALRSLQFSLAGTLMLPYWRSGDRDRLLFESSGIGGSGDRAWPVRQPSFSGIDTELLSVDYQYQQFAFENSVPRLRGGEKIPVIAFLDRIKAGFEEGYRAILKHREELLSAAGPLEEFRNIESRLVFRDTQDYANLLFWTTAPDLLTSGAAHDVALETLAGAVPVFGNGNSWPQITDEEKRSLWQRDLPIAYGCPTSTAILFPSGRTFDPIVPLSMFEQMRERLAEASPRDCEWQKNIAQALFELAATRTPNSSGPLAAAREIGEELARTTVRHETGVAWLSFARLGGAAGRVYPVQDDPWSLNGSAGNALFLANLARVTGEQHYEALAREGLANAAHSLDRVFEGPFSEHVSGSAFLGSFGLVYALAASGVQLRDDALIGQAIGLALRHTPTRLRTERNPDFLTGAAGPVALLSWLYRLTREPEVLRIARGFAEVIEDCAVAGGREGWQVPAFHRPLLGMAHGSAGIAMALARLYRETGDESFLEGARAGIAHERSQFDSTERQWPNLQEPDGRVSFMSGWCAGPAGIGLARLSVASMFPGDDGIAEEIAAAATATRGQLAGFQHHLCCGEAGRIAFLRAGGFDKEARDAAGRMLDTVQCLGYWRLQEFSERMPIPGLLGGVAGVGLTLLSVVDSECSEVLTLS